MLFDNMMVAESRYEIEGMSKKTSYTEAITYLCFMRALAISEEIRVSPDN